ncbi:MAG: hypothetical protein JNG85_05350 [Spirochaetaceae bacterium]|nr:hypothetical protein [Spirochaetaceae bacterium]
MKKFFAVFLLVAVIGTGAFAQITLGVSGALHMDSQLSASQIQDRFAKGEGIFYGPFVEVIFGNLGLGLNANLSFYTGAGSLAPYGASIDGIQMLDYDVDLYLSYHLFGGRAFLDPFAELGFGVMATTFASETDQAIIPWDGPLLASSYWYGALGLGINLGGIGIFGKFAYNNAIPTPVSAEWKPAYGTGQTDLPGYGYDAVLFPNGYLPKYRVTFGVKLIL